MATAMGTIGLGTSLAGGLLSAYGNYQSGVANEKMYNYRAAVADINSKINMQNSDYALTVGEKQGVQYGMKAAQTQGQIKVGQAASGLDVNTGSAKNVQDSQSKITRMDLDTIRSNAAKTAYDYRVAATSDQNQAAMDRAAASNAKRAGTLGALGSLIGTASSVSSKWMQGKTAGLWGNDSGGVTLWGPDMNVTGYIA